MFDEHVFFFSYSKNAISYKVKKAPKEISFSECLCDSIGVKVLNCKGGRNVPSSAKLVLCLLLKRGSRNKKAPESKYSQTLCNRKTLIAKKQLLILTLLL